METEMGEAKKVISLKEKEFKQIYSE